MPTSYADHQTGLSPEFAPLSQVVSAPPAHPSSGPWILYAEDDSIVREIASTWLTEAGYNVVTVADGGEAWGELHINRFALLITDNDMPGLTGLELILKLRREDVSLSVILASGALGVLDGPALSRLCLSARLQKPFTRDELLNAVRTALR